MHGDNLVKSVITMTRRWKSWHWQDWGGLSK